MSYYQVDPKRPALLGHCSYGVKDLKISEPFYTAIFKPFGIEIVYQDSKNIAEAKMVGYGVKGVSGGEWVFLFQRPDSTAARDGTHMAWNAPSRAAVDEFHAAALKHGGRDDGPPGTREGCGPLYYCCFVFDPDGHRFEAVHYQAADCAPEAGQGGN